MVCKWCGLGVLGRSGVSLVGEWCGGVAGEVVVLYGSMRDFRRPHLGSDGLFLKFWLDADSIVVSHTVREVWGFP